jgi:hypothetical protein
MLNPASKDERVPVIHLLLATQLMLSFLLVGLEPALVLVRSES